MGAEEESPKRVASEAKAPQGAVFFGYFLAPWGARGERHSCPTGRLCRPVRAKKK